MNEILAQHIYPQDDSPHYMLRLFVTGTSVNSQKAIVNVKLICETYIKERYSLEIIDVHQQKSVAEKEQIIALPLLIKSQPSPVKRMIGDMSDTQKVLKGLGIVI